MKNVRLFYKKSGAARFVSHLDTMRFMTRLLRRAELPVWYTEGFNPHLYITFALPLSLGMSSEYEIADIRLTDDDFPLDEICEKLNANSTDGYFFFNADEPADKLSDVAFAEFLVTFDDDGQFAESLKSFLESDEIIIEKKTKKGDIKAINVKENIKSFCVTAKQNTCLKITLPAGNQQNINPDLIVKKFSGVNNCNCFTKTTRLSLLNSELKYIK